MHLRNEKRHSIHDVNGLLRDVTTWHGNGNAKAPNEIANQKWTSERRAVDPDYWGEGAYMTVTLRYDDQCKNGHKSFAITADIQRPSARDVEACGCLHDEIRQYFPELSGLIAWHGVSDDGPLHYIANTCYLASNRDCHGLLKGEAKQIINGRTKLPVWECVVIGPDGEEKRIPSWANAETKPDLAHKLEWRPVLRIGEGKERDLDAARRCANWPDAPTELLTGPRDKLKKALRDRLPALIAAFNKDMAATGFICDVTNDLESK